jgi:hypothetical protein
MLRRIIVLLCVVSVVALGLQPATAHSAMMMDHAAMAAPMSMDCCPPDQGGPASDCPQSLACVAACTVTPTAATIDLISTPDTHAVRGGLFALIVAPPLSQSDPPFRPPSA